jgi:signal transduction histidine kinase
VENFPASIQSSLDGLARVATIVRSVKEFAHPDQSEVTSVDLNRAIENTLTIARGEYKYVADVKMELGNLPPVACCASELNQAILNIIVNAAHAIADVVKNTGQRGAITIRTQHEGASVVISIADSGGGISREIRDKIYDPFFTTKEVGRGTGQGLAIARSVIVDKHGGELSFETVLGKGTTFFIRIPVARKPSEGRTSNAT